jgi:NAD+ kinase
MTKKQTQSKKKTTTPVKKETKNKKEATTADIEAAIKNASSLPESDDLQAQLAEAQQSAKDNWDKVVRAQAEMENLKRRNAKDLENAHKFALDGFVKALLEVKDSLSMGLKTAKEETATIESIIEGLEMTDKVFLSTMVKFGVGFLADVPVTNMEEIVSEVLNGDFTKEERRLLSCQVEQDGKILRQFLALNDAVVHRTETLKMIEFDLFIDDKFVSNQRADGLIITTPTGSTAYALSSGGPIMHPGVDAIGLVSICPHTMSHRPLLVPGDSEIVIKVKNSEDGAIVSFDGQTSVPIKTGQDIRLHQYSSAIDLLHPKNYDYFEIIRSKLHWGTKL